VIFELLFLLHPVARIDWVRWTIHPSTVIGIAVVAGLYVYATRRATRKPSSIQSLSFFSGLFVIFASLNGPLHDLSDYYLFSAHMVQHLLLTLLVPPLLLAGLTGDMLRPLIRNPRVMSVARFFTKPIVCFAVFNLVIAAWHLPPLYNSAMAEHGVHIGEHLMFMAAAVLMWWPFLSPLPELPRLSYPGQMLYCFLTIIPMSVVAVYITMADSILYPAYTASPRIWGLSPLEDQQLGGLIMWIPGAIVFYAILTVVFFKWQKLGRDDAAAAQVLS
jgi:putative membrane protein